MTGRDDLAARWQRGDEGAAAEVYARYGSGVHDAVRAALRNWADAEDVTQQIFVKALEARPRFDPEGSASLKTWLFVIARNAVIDVLRRRGRMCPEEPARIAELCDADLPRSELEVNLGLLSGSELEMPMRRLPTTQRDALILRYVLDFSRADAAAAMEKTERAVYDLERRGAASLKLHLLRTRRRWRSGSRPAPAGELREHATGR